MTRLKLYRSLIKVIIISDLLCYLKGTDTKHTRKILVCPYVKLCCVINFHDLRKVHAITKKGLLKVLAAKSCLRRYV